MQVDIKGNPGTGNVFNSTEIERVENYIQNATMITRGGSSRMANYFTKLEQEILKKVKKETIDELLYYKTKIKGTKDLREKLTDGGFGEQFIENAERQKIWFAKHASKYDCYPSAQQINLDLFARIKNEFYTNVFPLIQRGEDHVIVMKSIRNSIVIPIMKILDESGAHDEHLMYTEDHIYGMIFYLTGMCHLNWTDYDNL